MGAETRARSAAAPVALELFPERHRTRSRDATPPPVVFKRARAPAGGAKLKPIAAELRRELDASAAMRAKTLADARATAADAERRYGGLEARGISAVELVRARGAVEGVDQINRAEGELRALLVRPDPIQLRAWLRRTDRTLWHLGRASFPWRMTINDNRLFYVPSQMRVVDYSDHRQIAIANIVTPRLSVLAEKIRPSLRGSDARLRTPNANDALTPAAAKLIRDASASFLGDLSEPRKLAADEVEALARAPSPRALFAVWRPRALRKVVALSSNRFGPLPEPLAAAKELLDVISTVEQALEQSGFRVAPAVPDEKVAGPARERLLGVAGAIRARVAHRGLLPSDRFHAPGLAADAPAESKLDSALAMADATLAALGIAMAHVNVVPNSDQAYAQGNQVFVGQNLVNELSAHALAQLVLHEVGHIDADHTGLSGELMRALHELGWISTADFNQVKRDDERDADVYAAIGAWIFDPNGVPAFAAYLADRDDPATDTHPASADRAQTIAALVSVFDQATAIASGDEAGASQAAGAFGVGPNLFGDAALDGELGGPGVDGNPMWGADVHPAGLGFDGGFSPFGEGGSHPFGGIGGGEGGGGEGGGGEGGGGEGGGGGGGDGGGGG